MRLWVTESSYPIDGRLILFSSTRAGEQGEYDLYLGDCEEGASWSLSSPGLNTPQEELGACYHRGPLLARKSKQ